MKGMMQAVAFGVCAVLFGPTGAGAQEASDARFVSLNELWSADNQPILPSEPRLHPAAASADLVVAGAIAGFFVGAGVGYLLFRDSTAGCDDGLCGWVVPAAIGGGIGMLAGGLISVRMFGDSPAVSVTARVGRGNAPLPRLRGWSSQNDR